MKKIVVWMLTFILIFSTLPISEAETSVDPENAVTEDDGQIESESAEESAPENDAQTESENKEEPPAAGEEQTESESTEESTTENEANTESNGEKEPPATGEEQTESDKEEKPETNCEEGLAIDCEEQAESGDKEKPEAECEEELETDCEKPEESASEENLTVTLVSDGEYTDGGYRITGTLSKVNQPTILYYKVDDNDEKKIAEFENTDTDAAVPWAYTILNDEVKKGLDHDITIYAENESGAKSNEETIKIRPALTITEQVFDEDDHEVEEIAPEKTVSYKIVVETDYIEEDTGTYGEVNITQQYATRLEQPADLKVIDEEGTEVGTASYNESANVIEATLDANLPRSTKVNITYNAKVKTDMEEEEYIISQATASGEYSTGDEANETSDKTKILITKARIKISDVGKIGNIDFSPLDKDDPLVGFKEMTENSLLEFSKEESSGRKYFMLFGDYNNNRHKGILEGGAEMIFEDDSKRPLPSKDTTLEALMQSKYIHAQNFAVMTLFPHPEWNGTATYYYNNGKPSENQVGNGLVIAQGNDQNRSPEFQSTEMPILKLFKNEKTHELIAYAAVVNGDYLDGYVKIKMSSVSSSKGLVNISMKFLKLNDEYQYTNFAYNVRTDIGNLYNYDYRPPINSLGNNKGFYFVVDEKVMKEHRNDEHPYYLYFFRDGYANHPAELKVNDEPANQPFSKDFYPTMSSLGSEDPGENAEYPFTQDPGWSLRWATDEQKYGDVREANLELMVTDSDQHTIVQEVKLDKDIEYTNDGYHIKGTWNDDRGKLVTLYYTIDGGEPKKIEEYENKNPGTDVQWKHKILKDEMKKGLDHTITVFMKNESGFTSDEKTTKISPEFIMTEQVFDKDGEVAERVAPEGTVNYKIAVETNYIEEAGGTYGQVSITQKYATSLERPTDLKVINKDGEDVGTATYNDSANVIEITLDENLPRSTKINITYNAKVKKDMENEYIISQTTASGKYSTGDEINKTSDETKILITSLLDRTRKKISEVGKIGKINFALLNDPNELDGFEQMTENRLLEFPVDEPESIGRRYFMHFGDYNGERNKNNLEGNSPKDYGDDSKRPLPSDDITLEALMQGKYIMAQNFAVMTLLPHSKDYGAITYYNRQGLSSGYHESNGLVIAQGNAENGKAESQSTKMPVLKLYKNEATHELMAYAAVINGDYVDGYVKIKMRPVSSKGRVNVSIKYLKLNAEYTYTNFAYRVNLDVASLYSNPPGVITYINSLGNDKGFYFVMDNGYMNNYRHDNNPYYLYFFRDGYANHPTVFKSHKSDFESLPFSDAFYSTLKSPGTKDPGKGKIYEDLADKRKRGWALRWEPKEQEFGQVREANLEIMATSSANLLEVKLDNDGEYTDNGYHISGTWNDDKGENVTLYYTIDGSEPQKIGEYENKKPGENVPWNFTIPNDKGQVKKGLDHDITVYIKNKSGMTSNKEKIKIRPTLTITEQVFDEGGKEAEEVAPGETLSYSILVDTDYIAEDKGKYDQFKITQKYNTNLNPPADLKVINEDRKDVGTAKYNESANIIEVSLNDNADRSRSKKIYVTYNATVKEDAVKGATIVGQATVSGEYSTKDKFNATSNKVTTVIVAAVLKFNSAPKVIDFGKDLVISPRTKKYYPIKLDMPLAVKDTRNLSWETPGFWEVTAKLSEPLIGKTGAEIDYLSYRKGDDVSIFTENFSAKIYTREPTDGRRTIDISSTWSEDEDGLYLEVLAGKARADAFEGTITWTLQDVPPNE
ncbi:hypothetical protein [Lysinibacillus sp. NPDC059133]|uniref:isopeptide-forming domain-containing fimbrial protein n=1 Tax=Lysinibacillus sp. NPDC059133 TaxID=3346737 RepID=UPI0036AE82B3